MIVKLDRVVFDHGLGSAGTRALHIRRDRRKEADANVAAYALAPTDGHRLKIVGEFTFEPQPDIATPPSIHIRARAVSTDLGVLGNVKDTVVTIPVGRGPSGPIRLSLDGVAIHEHGVGKYNVAWDWQFRLPGSSMWVSFARSDHVIYVTLDRPRTPWTQATGAVPSKRWPWTRVLDWACERAAGVTLAGGKEAAAKKIAVKLEASIFQLGEQGLLAYGGGDEFIVGKGAGVFKATKFVRLLEGHATDIPTFLYCTECAVALAVLANCLGADLTLLKVQRKPPSVRLLDVNRIVKIGERRSTSPSFFYHEVAVQRRATGSKRVFDACLQPDWDTNLSDKVNDFRLTRGRSLGLLAMRGTPTAYLQRLVEPNERIWKELETIAGVMPCLESCDGGRPPVDSSVNALQQRFRQQIDALSPRVSPVFRAPNIIRPIALEGFEVYDRVDNPPHLAALRSLAGKSAGFAYVATGRRRKRAQRREDLRFRVSTAWFKTSAQARDAMAWLMTRNNEPLTPLKVTGSRKLGGVAFATRNQRTVYLVSGNSIARVASIGRTLMPTGRIAERVDAVNRRNSTMSGGGTTALPSTAKPSRARKRVNPNSATRAD